MSRHRGTNASAGTGDPAGHEDGERPRHWPAPGPATSCRRGGAEHPDMAGRRVTELDPAAAQIGSACVFPDLPHHST